MKRMMWSAVLGCLVSLPQFGWPVSVEAASNPRPNVVFILPTIGAGETSAVTEINKSRLPISTGRREFLVETIKAFNPDLLGTQETLGFQRDYLAEQLSTCEKCGVGRDDGKERGEMTAVYYKKDRFEKLDARSDGWCRFQSLLSATFHSANPYWPGSGASAPARLPRCHLPKCPVA